MKDFVYVEWDDHCSSNGWNNINHDYSAIKIATIGWIVRESKESLTITTCQSELGNYRDAITIIKSCITHRCECELPWLKKFPWQDK